MVDLPIKRVLIPMYAGMIHSSINSFLKEKSDLELNDIVQKYVSQKFISKLWYRHINKYSLKNVDYLSAKAVLNMRRLGIKEFNPGPKVRDVFNELSMLKVDYNGKS